MTQSAIDPMRGGPQLQTEADMIKAIREAGRTPVQRNTFYEVLAHGDQFSFSSLIPSIGPTFILVSAVHFASFNETLFPCGDYYYSSR